MNSQNKTMPVRLFFGLALIALASALSGCVGMTSAPEPVVQAPEPFRQPLAVGWEGDALIAENHVAADGLVSNLVNRLPRGAHILCATFVNRDNFDESSSFGRLTASQFVSRLSQAGFGVMEIRLRQEMGIRVREGEFALSRKTAQYMSEKYDAHAILVGSYTKDKHAVFVSSRVVRLDTGVVLAAYDYAVQHTGVVQRLLDDGTKEVEFAGYLRKRGDQGMKSDAGMNDLGLGLGPGLGIGPVPQPLPGMDPGVLDLAPPTESGGPVELFPPTRLQ